MKTINRTRAALVTSAPQRSPRVAPDRPGSGVWSDLRCPALLRAPRRSLAPVTTVVAVATLLGVQWIAGRSSNSSVASEGEG